MAAPLRPADQGAQPGEELLDPEGFGEVIVGPGVDPLHLLVPGVARGQDEHGHEVAGLAPAAEHGEAVEPGQAQVEHDRVVGLGRTQELAGLAVDGAVDGVALAGEALAELGREIGVVLDEEHAHGSSAQPSPSRKGAPLAAS